jgi:hypothetical protein
VIVAVPGAATPARRHVVEPIEAWLAGLRWAPAQREADAGTWNAPQRTFEASGSVVTLEAYPKPSRLRYDRTIRTIWAGPVEGGTVDERAPVLQDLRSKASAYGRPNAPFVIAVLCLRDFVSYDDIENALYGREVVQIPHWTGWGSSRRLLPDARLQGAVAAGAKPKVHTGVRRDWRRWSGPVVRRWRTAVAVEKPLGGSPPRRRVALAHYGR